MIRNQGKDSTLEPAYFAVAPKGTSSGSDEARLRRLEELVADLEKVVEGTAAEGFKDGLVEKVNELQIIVEELQERLPNIYYDTTANWNAQPQLIAQKGAIYIYSDGRKYNGVDIPRLKVGTGTAYLIDLYFIDSDIIDYLDSITTVTIEEKERWNNKVSCSIEENNENLIFSTE